MVIIRNLIVIILGLVSFGTSCKSGGCNVIPDVAGMRLQVSLQQYHSLTVPGGSALIQGGVAGIVVYNTGNGYVAYDRCSTVNPEKRCAVEIDDTGLILVDSCSGARYDIRSGLPGRIAECPLKRYSVSPLIGNLFYIQN